MSAKLLPFLPLPDGMSTQDEEEYVSAWRRLATDYASTVNGKEVHVEHRGWDEYDKTISFSVNIPKRGGPRTVTLPIALMRATLALRKGSS